MAQLKHWLYLILLASIWGSSFILIKRGLFTSQGQELFTGLQVGAMRVVIAALVMAPIAFRKANILRGGKIKYFFMVGLFGNALPAFFFAVAQTEIPSALAGMLNATVPLFSLILAFFVFKVRVNHWQVTGIFIGLFSVIGLLLSSGQILGSEVNIWYALLVLGATICYAISLNIIKQFLQSESAIAITGVALVFVSPIGIAILLATDFIHRLQTTSGAWYGVGAISILGVIGTAIALIIFNKLVKETNTIFASSVTYLVPLISIFWGIADGETLGTLQISCAIAMLGGIVLINRNKPQGTDSR